MVKPYFAGVIPYNPPDKTVFLQLRDGNTAYYPHYWNSFGGSSEPEDHNNPLLTAQRELTEEIGHTFDTTEFIPLRQNVGLISRKKRYIYYVICELPKSAFTLGEGADFAWHPLAAVTDLKLSPETIKDLHRLQHIL